MRPKYVIYILITILLNGCAVTWQEALTYGEVPDVFSDSVNTENYLGLMIVPVTINGQEYRFLYDTGAPFSISHRVQDACGFDVLTGGQIIDSDNNKSKIEYVQVDSLLLGSTPFVDQTAFVGDFSTNPKIGCLEIDGIIGSNFMQHCNWTVDFNNNLLSYYNTSVDTVGCAKVSFYTNSQYDILVNLRMGEAKVNNVKIDYGSNGILSIEEQDFAQLMDLGVCDTFLLETGVSRSGIVGKEVPIEDKISHLDSLQLGGVLFRNVIYSSSSSSLLGTKMLSQYTVTIDWTNHQLYFKPTAALSSPYTTFAFSAGYSENKGFYIQSVVQGSSADELGLQSGMAIHKINGQTFTKTNFCDYVQLMNQDPNTLHLVIEKDSTLVPITIVKDELF